jgi:hypothetical protein
MDKNRKTSKGREKNAVYASSSGDAGKPISTPTTLLSLFTSSSSAFVRCFSSLSAVRSKVASSAAAEEESFALAGGAGRAGGRGGRGGTREDVVGAVDPA